jgi:hypothetical protein
MTHTHTWCTHTHTTLDENSLEEVSARYRDLCLKIRNIHKSSMPQAGFEPEIATGDFPQAYS